MPELTQEHLDGLDKRTKTYKELKAAFDRKKANEKFNEGLGDVVESITEATGVKKVMKGIFGDDCGCEDRKRKLNKVFSFNTVSCIEEEDYKWLVSFLQPGRTRIRPEQQQRLVNINNYVFGDRKEVSNCPSCVRALMNRLLKYLEVGHEAPSDEEE